MSDLNYNANRMSLNSFNRTTLSVFAAVAAAIFVIGAIYTYNNSIGSDTSGDDTRPVVNNAPPDGCRPSPYHSIQSDHTVTCYSIDAAVVHSGSKPHLYSEQRTHVRQVRYGLKSAAMNSTAHKKQLQGMAEAWELRAREREKQLQKTNLKD